MPTFFVKDKPQPGMFHFSEEIPEHYAREFRKAGFIFYSSIDKFGFLDLGWKSDGVFDFTRHDRVISLFAERIPEGYLLPKIHMWAPEWWIDKHPDQAVGFEFEIKPEDYKYVIASGPKHESFASELWRKEAGEGLRRLVRHMLEAPYIDRVLGVFVAGGTSGEWLASQWMPGNYIDNSEPMKRTFIRYLKKNMLLISIYFVTHGMIQMLLLKMFRYQNQLSDLREMTDFLSTLVNHAKLLIITKPFMKLSSR